MTHFSPNFFIMKIIVFLLVLFVTTNQSMEKEEEIPLTYFCQIDEKNNAYVGKIKDILYFAQKIDETNFIAMNIDSRKLLDPKQAHCCWAGLRAQYYLQILEKHLEPKKGKS